jgi:hypothetical protein
VVAATVVSRAVGVGKIIAGASSASEAVLELLHQLHSSLQLGTVTPIVIMFKLARARPFTATLRAANVNPKYSIYIIIIN